MGPKLKSIHRFTSHYKLLSFNDAPEKDGEFKSSLMLFDEKGNISEEVKYTREGDVEERIQNTYDANNKLTEESIHFVLDNTFEKRQIKRNAKGLPIEERKEYADGSVDLTLYNLDPQDNIAEVLKFNEDNTLEGKVILAYENHKLIEEKKYDGQDQVLEHRKQSYDAQGNIKEVTEYSPEENIAYTTVYEYDQKGNNTSSSYFDANYNLIVKTTSIHDEKGNLTEKFIEDFSSSSGRKTMRFAYDENNNCIEEAVFAANGNLIRKLSTQFDDLGNPIEELNFEVDLSHGGRDEYFGNRYEYEFFD
jgi:hypothetical protein